MTEIATEDRTQTLPAFVRACCQVLDDKKGESLKVLDVRGISSVTDYFIIVTGTSNPHLRALSNAVRNILEEWDMPTIKADTKTESGWLVVDAYELIVHVFTEEVREYFDLEGLWRDAESLAWQG